MHQSLSTQLETSRNLWPPHMVAAHASKVDRLAKRLPQASGVIFERRMHDPFAPCDLSIRASREDGMIDFLGSEKGTRALRSA